MILGNALTKMAAAAAAAGLKVKGTQQESSTHKKGEREGERVSRFGEPTVTDRKASTSPVVVH